MDPVTTLVDRIATDTAAAKVAILGLTRGAGTATTLGHLMRGLQERGDNVGIAASGREEDDVEFTQPPQGLSLHLHKGTIVATTAAAQGRGTASVETIATTGIETPQGPVLVVRV